MAATVITIDGAEKMVVVDKGWAYEVGSLSGNRTGHCYEVKDNHVCAWSDDQGGNIVIPLESR